MPSPNATLRVIRLQRGMTVRDLAREAGVAPATVSRIETGVRNGSLATLARIADALDVDPELLGGLAAQGQDSAA